jgi:hypothetical protein
MTGQNHESAGSGVTPDLVTACTGTSEAVTEDVKLTCNVAITETS